MENILLPSKIVLEQGAKPNTSVLVVEPCFQGYGTTVGNALRRVLLSSLSGAAVTAVKIRGIQHEFTAIPNVKEDALEVTLNLKQLRMKLFSDEPVRLSLKVKGERAVTAADFEKNSAVEIANPDLHIATLTSKDATLELEVIVSKGRGFSAIEDRDTKAANAELGMIQVDALFSPVRGVGYSVESARVGEITNYDKLTMTIETDGTISTEDAVKEASRILIEHFSLLMNQSFADNGSAAPASGSMEIAETAPSVEVQQAEAESVVAEEKPKKKKKVTE